MLKIVVFCFFLRVPLFQTNYNSNPKQKTLNRVPRNCRLRYCQLGGPSCKVTNTGVISKNIINNVHPHATTKVTLRSILHDEA